MSMSSIGRVVMALTRYAVKGSDTCWQVGMFFAKGRDFSGHPFPVESFDVGHTINVQDEMCVEKGHAEMPIMSFPSRKDKSTIYHQIVMFMPSICDSRFGDIVKKFEPVPICLKKNLLCK